VQRVAVERSRDRAFNRFHIAPQSGVEWSFHRAGASLGNSEERTKRALPHVSDVSVYSRLHRANERVIRFFIIRNITTLLEHINTYILRNGSFLATGSQRRAQTRSGLGELPFGFNHFYDGFQIRTVSDILRRYGVEILFSVD